MPLKNILVAANLEETGLAALIRAVRLARLSGASLHVLHVTRRLHHRDASREAAEYHDELVARIRELVRQHSNSTEADCVVHLEHGRVADNIIRRSLAVPADLIVMGRSARADVLPDSVFLTTGQVLADASMPVLIVTQPVSGDYGHVVLEGDLSVPPGDRVTLVRELGAEGRLSVLVKATGERRNPGLLGRLLARLRRRGRERYVGGATAPPGSDGDLGNDVSVDFISEAYEEILLSKLADENVDLVGLIHMRDKLARRDSQMHIIAALQTASCDVLAWSS